MTTILKGDTSAAVTVALAAGYDYSGATVEIAYQGVVRRFTGVSAGSTVDFAFTTKETSVMALGAFPVHAKVYGADGRVTTVNNKGAKICVTNIPEEVYTDGVIAIDIRGGLYELTDLPERYTDKDIVAKIREILRKGGAVLCALLVLSSFAASVTKTNKEDVCNDQGVVTDVDLSGLAAENDVAKEIARVEALTQTNANAIGENRIQIETNAAQIATNSADIAAVSTAATSYTDAVAATKADAVWVEATNDYWTVESSNRTLNGLVLTKNGEGPFWDLDPTVYNLEDMPSIIFGFYGDRWQYYDSIYVSTAFIDAPESAAYIEATTGFSHYSNTVYLTRHTTSRTNTVVYSGKYDADHSALTKTLSNKADRYKTTRELVDFNFYGMGHPRENFWHGEDDVLEPVIDEYPVSGFWDSRSRQVQWDLWWEDGVWRTRTYYSYWPDGEEEVISENRMEASRETNGVFGHWRNPATEVWRETTSQMVYSDSVDGILLSTITAIDEERLDTVGGIAEILISLKRQFEALKTKEENRE